MSASGDSRRFLSVSDDDHVLIVDAIMGCTGVQKLIQLRTLSVAADDLLVIARVALVENATVREAADEIDVIKTRIRAAVPAARSIYIEPDIYRPGLDPEPPTDAFVLKSED